jgi:methionine--tRNA ligase beta chain
MITLKDFQQLEIKIGQITAAERLPKSEKLLKLTVDLGSESRQIIAGLGTSYEPEQLIGQQVPILANLEPKSLMGEISNGMVLAASRDGQPVLLEPKNPVELGANIR